MRPKPSLILCIFMDMIGYLTYLLPVIGEWGDIIWAPISAFIFYKIFGGKTGKVGAFISFAEELLPFVDFIPTFTIGYIYNLFKKDK